MATWEYQLIELFHRPEYQAAEAPVVRATNAVLEDLERAGKHGWEAVGEITVESGGFHKPVILMKRHRKDD